MNNFWIGLFLGVTVIVLLSNYKEDKDDIKQAKDENKKLIDIKREKEKDLVEENKLKVLDELGISNLIYNKSIRTLSNIFRIVAIILLVMLVFVIAMSLS